MTESGRTIRGSWYRRLFREPLGLPGAAVVLLLAWVALLAPLLAPYPSGAQDLSLRLSPPSRVHPLGLDELGRDILSRLIYGSRISLVLGITVVVASTLAGLAIGSLAGLLGGWVDGLLTRLIDIFLAFPGILLAISLIAVMGPGLGNLAIALCLMGWAGYARLTRALVLRLREREYILSARAAGAGLPRLLRAHLLPNISGPILVQATAGIAGVILSEAGLSFLGLGLPPPNPSWGSMLRSGSQHLIDAPHLILYPGAAILLVVLSFNSLGDSIRRWLEPTLVAGRGTRWGTD